MVGLFSNEEMEKLLLPLRSKHDQNSYGTSSVFDLLTSRVMDNLHVVLVMNPENDEYARRCQSNPSILEKCSVQWLETWSVDGMKQLTLRKMKVQSSSNSQV